VSNEGGVGPRGVIASRLTPVTGIGRFWSRAGNQLREQKRATLV
jgi:hypothetical protein